MSQLVLMKGNLLSRVQAFSELLPGLEIRYALFLNIHGVAGSGISPSPRVSAFYGERTKTPQFYSIPILQCLRDFIEDGRNDPFNVSLI